MDIFHWWVLASGLIGAMLYFGNGGDYGGQPIRRGVGFRVMGSSIVAGIGMALNWLHGPFTEYTSLMFYATGSLCIGGMGTLAIFCILGIGELQSAARFDQIMDSAYARRGMGTSEGPVYTPSGGPVEDEPMQYNDGLHETFLERENRRGLPHTLAYTLPEHQVEQIVEMHRYGGLQKEQALSRMREVLGRDQFDRREEELKGLLRR